MSLVVNPYTEKSFIVYHSGSADGTKPYKDKLKELGGKYCPRLTWDDNGKNEECDARPAYVFANPKKDSVLRWISDGASIEVATASGGGNSIDSREFERLVRQNKQLRDTVRQLIERVEELEERMNNAE